jgi:ferredoxin-NADP reductase
MQPKFFKLLITTIKYSLLTTLIAFNHANAQSAHEKHHPGVVEENKVSNNQTPSTQNPIAQVPVKAGMSKGGMGGMGMGGAGKGGMAGFGKDKMALGMKGKLPTPKNLYPTLMSLPELNFEQREKAKRQAKQRMVSGMTMINDNLLQLAQASQNNDHANMQLATQSIYQGLGQFDSGLAVQQALEQGRKPRNIALDWFKTELNISPRNNNSVSTQPSYFHWFIMGLLLTFVVLALIIHFFKMRHATKLLQHLVETDSVKLAPEPSASPVPTPKWNGRLQVTRIFQETPEVKTFRLVNADGGAIPFSYEPGQYLPIRLKVNGETVKRIYTIASSPSQRYYCELTIKREEHGLMSRFMHDKVNEGDLIEADKPGGKFTFDGSTADSIVLIGGGVGITPLMTVLRYLTDSGWKKPIYLLFSCKSLDDFIFRKELEYLNMRNNNMVLHCFVSKLTKDVAYAEQGRINAQRINELVPNIDKRLVHFCGSPAMMDAIKTMLAELNVPAAQAKNEAFGTGKPKKTVSIDSAVDSDPKVTFKNSEKTAPQPECCTLLDVAENIGVEIESSCLMGSCGMCMTKLVSGEVTMECEDALDDSDKAAGMVLACQAHAKTDIVVEA